MPANTPINPRHPPTHGRAVSCETVFGVNEMRLNGRNWLVVLAITAACALLAPIVWKRVETLNPGQDYRLPYALSNDYWLYQRRLEKLNARQIPILGDSVVWGEYVREDGTLSHFLNREIGGERFANCGVNGLFPLALEGLIEDYGSSLRNRKVIVQCNLLWLSSLKADLSAEKEENFNHSRLVPQFSVRIPCYRANASSRMSAILERRIDFFAWISHLQTAYYDQHSIAQWTLQDDGNEPPRYPNAWRNPLAPLRSPLPSEPAGDPQRGPDSPRHKPWDSSGASPAHFDWVAIDKSLQWAAFQRLTHLLRARGNDVLIILSPFNEHMIAEEQRPEFRALRDCAAASLRQDGVRVVVPEALPGNLYADSSHPLTNGYALLARELAADPGFLQWISLGQSR